MEVVVKELHLRASRGEKTEDAQKRVKEELIYEARIMNKLGGVPMLFGISIDSVPYRIIMQFHGEKHGSVSIASALHEKKISQLSESLGVAKALSHIHELGFWHNSLKCNNVVLDRQQKNKSHYTPVIIDFGKCSHQQCKGAKDNVGEEAKVI